MVDPTVISFIKDSLSKGYTKAQVEEALRKKGWQPAQIQEAIAAATARPTTQTTTTQQAKKPLNKKLLITIGVIITVLVVGTLAAVFLIPTAECETDRDCDSGFSCTDGECIEEMEEELECTRDSDCGSGEECIRNACVPVTVEEEEEVVVTEEEEEVTVECTSDEDCELLYGDGYECDTDAGSCEAVTTTTYEECTTDEECYSLYGDNYICDTDFGLCTEVEEINLILEDLAINPNSSRGTSTSELSFNVTINITEATLISDVIIACDLYLDNGSLADSDENKEDIDVDEATLDIIECSLDPTQVFDAFDDANSTNITVFAIVDADDDVNETDETDNNVTEEFEITADSFGVECLGDSVCGGYVCSSYVCVECESDSNCNSGYGCVSNTCTAAGSISCTSNDDCPSGYACANSTSYCGEDTDSNGTADIDEEMTAITVLDLGTDTDGDGLVDDIEDAHGFDKSADDLSAYLIFDLMGDDSTDYISHHDALTASYTSGTDDDGTPYFTFDGSTNSMNFSDDDLLDVNTLLIIDAIIRTNASFLDTDGVLVAKNIDSDACESPYNSYIMRQTKSGEGDYQFGTLLDTASARNVVRSGIGHGEEWRRLTGVWDGTTQYIYIDGVLSNSTSQAGTVETTLGQLLVGTSSCGYYFGGDIAELRMWGTAELDIDGDGVPNNEEETYGTDPHDTDTDDDGYTDEEELISGTDPLDAGDSPVVDSDGDGLSDSEESAIGTDPNDADTDDDGLTDYEEVQTYATNPVESDEDDDALTDYEEILYGTDPTKAQEFILNFTIGDWDLTHNGSASTYANAIDYLEDPDSGKKAEASDEDGGLLLQYNDPDYIKFGTVINETYYTYGIWDYLYFQVGKKWNFDETHIIKVVVRPSEHEASGTHPIVIKESDSCYSPVYSLSARDGEYRTAVKAGDTQYDVQGGLIDTNAWQEVIAVFTNDTLSLYVDGVLIGTETTTGDEGYSEEYVHIGMSDPDCDQVYSFEGDVASVQIWGHRYRCSDGEDNDGDGYTDYGTEATNDPDCSSYGDNKEEEGRRAAPEEAKGFFARLWEFLTTIDIKPIRRYFE